MNRTIREIRQRRLLAAVLLWTALLLTGCSLSGAPSDAGVEEVLQLENDVLEDPLLKELDALEASLLEAPPPEETAAPEEPQAPTEAPVQQASPTPAPAPEPQPPAATAPAAPLEPPPAEAARRVVFGQVRKADDAGVTLRVIEARTLTQEELRRIKNGERVQRYLVTDQILKLSYSGNTVFQIVIDGAAQGAARNDVAQGQTVRAALNKDGAVVALRILRE